MFRNEYNHVKDDKDKRVRDRVRIALIIGPTCYECVGHDGLFPRLFLKPIIFLLIFQPRYHGGRHYRVTNEIIDQNHSREICGRMCRLTRLTSFVVIGGCCCRLGVRTEIRAVRNRLIESGNVRLIVPEVERKSYLFLLKNLKRNTDLSAYPNPRTHLQSTFNAPSGVYRRIIRVREHKTKYGQLSSVTHRSSSRQVAIY